MSCKQMVSQEPKLAAEVASWLDEADAAEHAQHGPGHRGDETPDWMADKWCRLECIRAAKAQLKAEAKAGPGNIDPDRPAHTLVCRSTAPARTDPPTRRRQGAAQVHRRRLPRYAKPWRLPRRLNGQIAVDAAYQIITAQRLVTNPADFTGLIPLVDQARANKGRKLREVSGDTGFATEANWRRWPNAGSGPACRCVASGMARPITCIGKLLEKVKPNASANYS